jgi:hypothetical protein
MSECVGLAHSWADVLFDLGDDAPVSYSRAFQTIRRLLQMTGPSVGQNDDELRSPASVLKRSLLRLNEQLATGSV